MLPCCSLAVPYVHATLLPLVLQYIRSCYAAATALALHTFMLRCCHSLAVHTFMLRCCHFSCSTYVHVTQLPVLLHFHSEVGVGWGGVMTFMLPCFSLAFHTCVRAWQWRWENSTCHNLSQLTAWTLVKSKEWPPLGF